MHLLLVLLLPLLPQALCSSFALLRVDGRLLLLCMQLLLCWHCRLLLCLAVDAAAGLLCMQLPQSFQLLQQASVLLLTLLQCCLVALLLLLQLPGCCLLNHASYGNSTGQCSSLERRTQQVQQAEYMHF
jgi:hypothetical protein